MFEGGLQNPKIFAREPNTMRVLAAIVLVEGDSKRQQFVNMLL